MMKTNRPHTVKSDSLAHKPATNGKMLPAVPVLQQKPKGLVAAPQTAGVVQRVLSEDLHNSKITTAIVGEIHNEIPTAKEKSDWKKLGVNVVYEHGTIPGTARRPDPPVLRLAYAWKTIFDLKDFWHLIEANEDVADGPAVLEEFRTLAGFMRDELDEIGDVDDRIIRAKILLNSFLRGLPADEATLMSLPRRSQQYLAETKLELMQRLEGVIQSIHTLGSFGDVGFDLESLRIERSREMLKNINTLKPAKTIYKVGDSHVGDMITNNWKHDADIAVLPKSEYVPEYNDIDTEPSSGGRAVFNSVSNEML